MRIEEILKETQKDVYIELNKLRRKARVKYEERTPLKNRYRKIGIGNANISELMASRYYRRGRGGAIKQVR